MKVLSLFSGCGGLDLGFEAAGCSTVLAVDTLPPAAETYSLNRPGTSFFGPPSHSGDVRELTLERVEDLMGDDMADLDFIVGGPPCQPFSVAAAQRFLADDPRFKRVGFDSWEKGQLVFEFVNMVRLLRPKAFLIENVPGILSLDGGTGITHVYEELARVGYTLSDPFVVNAKDYGVPQSRVRAFVVGTLKKRRIVAPSPTHAAKSTLFLKRHVSVAQAFFELPRTLPNFETRDHSPKSISRYKKILPGGREPLGRVDRLDPRYPSKTVIAGGSRGGGRSHLHPYEARTLSVRECARLQTFPDDFIFRGSIGRQFTLVGNAVPPLLAEKIARHMLKEIFDFNFSGPCKFEVPEIDQDVAERALLKESELMASHLLYDDLLASQEQLGA
jgi:DNA (cytosine-5)-methyltransferase 1